MWRPQSGGPNGVRLEPDATHLSKAPTDHGNRLQFRAYGRAVAARCGPRRTSVEPIRITPCVTNMSQNGSPPLYKYATAPPAAATRIHAARPPRRHQQGPVSVSHSPARRYFPVAGFLIST